MKCKRKPNLMYPKTIYFILPFSPSPLFTESKSRKKSPGKKQLATQLKLNVNTMIVISSWSSSSQKLVDVDVMHACNSMANQNPLRLWNTQSLDSKKATNSLKRIHITSHSSLNFYFFLALCMSRHLHHQQKTLLTEKLTQCSVLWQQQQLLYNYDSFSTVLWLDWRGDPTLLCYYIPSSWMYVFPITN